MSLFLSRGEQKSSPIKSGTYGSINFSITKSAAVGVAQVIDLMLIQFGAKIYFGSGNTHEVVRYGNLYSLLQESSMDLFTKDIAFNNLFTIPAGVTQAFFNINLEGYIRLVGNDYLDINVMPLVAASPLDFDINVTIPKSIGVMDSLPTIDIIQIQNGVTNREEYIGSNVERITLVTKKAGAILESVQINSDKYNPLLLKQDIAMQSVEYFGTPNLVDDEMFSLHTHPKVLFDGTKRDDLLELDDVTLSLAFNQAVDGSYLVIRRSKTSSNMARYAERLRGKHEARRWAKKN
jgi:hypothetical protein